MSTAGLASLLILLGLPATPGSASRAPDFSLKNLAGHVVTLSDLKDDVVVVNFWATWCPPCRDEVPHLESFFQTHRDDGFIVVGIAMDSVRGEGLTAVKEFVDEFQVDYPIVLGDDGVAESFQVEGLPTTFIIDRNGLIVARINGYAAPEELAEKLGPLLEVKK